MEVFRSWKRITPNYRFHQIAVETRARTYTESMNIQYICLISIHPSFLLLSPLTFLKAVPEGAWSAHGASLLVKRHAGVSQAVVAARVKGNVLIGQAVVAQTGEIDLSCWGRAGRWGNDTGNDIWINQIIIFFIDESDNCLLTCQSSF